VSNVAVVVVVVVRTRRFPKQPSCGEGVSICAALRSAFVIFTGRRANHHRILAR
jgi:hypothetical protein